MQIAATHMVWWQVSGLPSLRVDDVRVWKSGDDADGSVAFIVYDGRRARIVVPGNAAWVNSPILSKARASALNGLADDALAVAGVSRRVRALPGAAKKQDWCGFPAWPWSADAAVKILHTARKSTMGKAALVAINRAIAPSWHEVWQSYVPCHDVVVCASTIELCGITWTKCVSWLVTHARQYGICLIKITAPSGKLTIPREHENAVLRELAKVKLYEYADKIQRNKASLLPPESAWSSTISHESNPILQSADYRDNAFFDWLRQHNIAVRRTRLITAATLKERQKHFETQLKRQMNRKMWNYPGPRCQDKARSQSKCVRCPLPNDFGQRHLVCGASQNDTPVSIALNAIELGSALPPCIQGFTGDSNYARFDMAIICAQIFYALPPAAKRVKR